MADPFKSSLRQKAHTAGALNAFGQVSANIRAGIGLAALLNRVGTQVIVDAAVGDQKFHQKTMFSLLEIPRDSSVDDINEATRAFVLGWDQMMGTFRFVAGLDTVEDVK